MYRYFSNLGLRSNSVRNGSETLPGDKTGAQVVKLKWDNTLLAFKEDVERSGFLDRMKAHTSFMKPLHRYEGTLELEGGKMIFSGKDKRKDEEFHMEVPVEDITDVDLGFDDTYKRRESRVPWNDPLRIKYESGKGKETVYLYVHFHREYGFRTSDNEVFHSELKKLIT